MGRFGRPRGVSGEIYVAPETDDPERFLELEEVTIVVEGSRQRLQLQKVEIIGGRPVVKIKGYDSRETVSRLTGRLVEIPLAQIRELPEGSYYQFDLVGCRVMDRDGTEYGEIEEVLFYPANDLYRVKSKKYGEILFPAVDRFIVRVDIDKKVIIVDPPPGLIEAKED